MNLPVGQHFVPRMLLKRFADPDGRLWAFDKRRPHRGIWQSTPKDLLRERHLYTATHADGSRDFTAEHAIDQLENTAEPIVERVVQRARAGLPPNLRGDDRTTLLLFLYIQHKRVPDFFRTIMPSAEVADFVRSSIERYEHLHGPVAAEEKAGLLSPEGLARFEQNARARNMVELSPKVLEALEARGFLIGMIEQPGGQFLIGSNPMARFKSPSGSTALDDPDVELWLPLAADVAIASHGRRGEERVMAPLSIDQVRHLNAGVVQQSTTIVSGSKALLEALTEPAS